MRSIMNLDTTRHSAGMRHHSAIFMHWTICIGCWCWTPVSMRIIIMLMEGWSQRPWSGWKAAWSRRRSRGLRLCRRGIIICFRRAVFIRQNAPWRTIWISFVFLRNTGFRCISADICMHSGSRSTRGNQEWATALTELRRLYSRPTAFRPVSTDG